VLFASAILVSSSALFAIAGEKKQSRCIVTGSDSLNEDWCMVDAGKNGEPCYCIFDSGLQAKGRIRN
jgi:hypothetical protein